MHSILWDLVDDLSDAGDNTRIDAATLWRAFTGLRSDRFVYLPAFLDRLVELVPSESLGTEQIVRGRSIDYRASARPSIADPFPRLVSDDHAVTGEVDSLSRQRVNLAQSAHQYAFDVAGGAVSLRLDITGVGPGGNPGANDLDLFLMDSEGRVLALSDQGLNGQSELISTFLTAGRYVVEVRSFYTHGASPEPGSSIRAPTVFSSNSISGCLQPLIFLLQVSSETPAGQGARREGDAGVRTTPLSFANPSPPSGRVGDSHPKLSGMPPTPPYVQFRIRRFIKIQGANALPGTTASPRGGMQPCVPPDACGWPRVPPRAAARSRLRSKPVSRR